MASKKQEKEARPSTAVASESLCSTILSRMVKDILGNELTTNIVSDVLNQQPRLYCFFDRNDPVKVSQMQQVNRSSAIPQISNLETNPQLSSRRPSVVNAEGTYHKPHEDTASIEEQRNLPIDHRYSLDVDRRHSDPSDHVNASRRGNNSPQLSATSQKDKDDTGRPKFSNVPDHLSPQDIIMESDQEQRQESVIQEDARGAHEAQTLKDKAIQNLLIKDEFKVASQAVFDDIFFLNAHFYGIYL